MALFPTAVAIALISFADTIVISRAFAARRGERVRSERELAALGDAPVPGTVARTPGHRPGGAVTRFLLAPPGVLDLQLAPPQHVQKRPVRLRLEWRAAAQRAGVEQRRPHVEVVQQRGEPVHRFGRSGQYSPRC